MIVLILAAVTVSMTTIITNTIKHDTAQKTQQLLIQNHHFNVVNQEFNKTLTACSKLTHPADCLTSLNYAQQSFQDTQP